MTPLEVIIAKMEGCMAEAVHYPAAGQVGLVFVTIADLRTLIEAAREKRK